MVSSFAELPRKDRPPREIWLDSDALTAHFDRLSDDSSGEETVPMASNELTKGLR